jgi:hypothetical protein
MSKWDQRSSLFRAISAQEFTTWIYKMAKEPLHAFWWPYKGSPDRTVVGCAKCGWCHPQSGSDEPIGTIDYSNEPLDDWPDFCMSDSSLCVSLRK